LRPVESPDVTIIPWINIIFFTVLAAILFFFRRVWLQFRERTIDPALENMGERFDDLDARADTARANARTRWGRFRAWLRSGR
jgi:hypothetical protein